MQTLCFQSDRFRPYLPDACQVNPNVLGFELAAWLSQQLAAEGFVTSYPSAEDWGWFLERTEGDAAYMICCSGEATDADHEWRVFVVRSKGLFQRMSRDARCGEILAMVAETLASSGIAATVEDAP